MNYINAGVISPDEVRSVIREDINSGYNALSEEMEGEPNEQDPFNDILGGNSTEQDPFNLDEWEESKHPRKENGQFGKGSGNGEQENNIEKSSISDKIKKRTRKEVQLPKEEYARVMSELNTNLPKEIKNKKVFRRSIGSYTYKVQNNGFNNYKIIGKHKINEMFD